MLLFLLLGACKSRNNELNVPGYELDTGEIEIPREAMDDIIRNVSSPIEMAALVKDMGLPFDNKSLTDLDHIDNYSSSFTMAYNLGMLTADLGYLNVYEKTGSSVNYLSAINRLADGLKISQFFDFITLKRLATSNSSLDSLIFMSIHSFNQMDEFLRSTDRSNLSALMVAGVWIEGMYQITRVSSQSSDEFLSEFIGEQKLILNNLLLILKNFEKDDQFAALIADFEQLRKIYEEVDISYELNDPQTNEENGMLTIVQQETSVVSISDETLYKIIDKTEKIRDKHQTM